MKLTHPKEFYKNYIADSIVDEIDKALFSAMEIIFRPLSIYEFGCGSGKNLQYIKQVHKEESDVDIETCGQDISPMNCLHAHLRGVDSVIIGDERHMPMRKFDVCFTVSVLDHIPPENIQQVIGNLQFMALQGIVIAEAELDDPENFYWNHDYSRWGFEKISTLKSKGDGNMYSIWKWVCAG